jgi:hypothetical protein
MVVYFKDWAEIKDHYGSLTPAEEKLKAAVAKGEPCLLGNGKLPEDPKDWSNPDPTRHIRADVLRFVLLQKVKHGEMTEFGTQIYGALITGTLHLDAATIPTLCGLIACRFENAIGTNRAQFISQAVFDNSTLPALSAMGTTFEGQLACNGARFEAANGNALNLQAAKIGSNLDFRDVTAASSVYIIGAAITGQITCEGARFEASEGNALNLQGAQIGDGFYFREVKAVKGPIDLTAANVSSLVDDAASWALVDDLILDGFRYDCIAGDTKPRFSERIDWLEKGSVFKGEFRPQPYTQLADTYKREGHDREARDVRIALAKKLNDHIRKDLIITPNGDISVGFKSAARDMWIGTLWCWHKLQLLLTGHGFIPQRALYALIFLVATCWWFTHKAWHAGDFAPNSDVILLSDDWGKYADAPNQAKAWAASQAGKDWESFSPMAYAADIVIPIVDFGQTQAWAPSTNREWWGKKLWWARWVFTAAGWIISAWGAAAITGVIRRE